jgi:hypothetical protein
MLVFLTGWNMAPCSTAGTARDRCSWPDAYDAETMVKCGLIDRSYDGKLHLPYDEVRVSFVCQAAA